MIHSRGVCPQTRIHHLSQPRSRSKVKMSHNQLPMVLLKYLEVSSRLSIPLDSRNSRAFQTYHPMIRSPDNQGQSAYGDQIVPLKQ